jgi:hypothetical protein
MSAKGKKNHHYWEGFKEGKAQHMTELTRKLEKVQRSYEHIYGALRDKDKVISKLRKKNSELQDGIKLLHAIREINKKSIIERIGNFITKVTKRGK